MKEVLIQPSILKLFMDLEDLSFGVSDSPHPPVKPLLCLFYDTANSLGLSPRKPISWYWSLDSFSINELRRFSKMGSMIYQSLDDTTVYVWQREPTRIRCTATMHPILTSRKDWRCSLQSIPGSHIIRMKGKSTTEREVGTKLSSSTMGRTVAPPGRSGT